MPDIKNRLKTIESKLKLKASELDAKKDRDKLFNEVKLYNENVRFVIQELKDIRKTIFNQQFPSYPKEIKISNLKQPKPIKEIEVKKPNWLKQFSLNELLNSLGELFSNLLNRRFKVDLEEYRSAKSPIAVRISDGNGFISKLVNGVSGIISTAFPFTDSSGKAKAARVDNDGTQQVRLTNPGDIEVGDVKVTDSVLPDGASTESTLQDVLTELGNKTEPTDVQLVEEQNPLDISTLAKESMQLPDNHNVTVSNQVDISELVKENKFPFENYQFMGDQEIGDYTYILNKEYQGTSWYVMRIKTSDNTIAYAYGTSGFDAIKADPTSGSYGDPPDA
jgi:hypothetical protein